MAIQFGAATRKKAKLRLAILGPAGSGKTWGALELASGLAPWEKIFVLDSERGSASLYADKGRFQVAELDGDYHPQRYIDGIKAAEAAGAEVIVIDSLSHAWNGTGGTLDLKGAAEQKSGNGWTAWRNVTPLHNALVEAMLNSTAHIVSTMRVKMEYVQDKDERGKTTIKKVGLQPVQRDGVEYEYSLVLDVDADHYATAAKDRTSLFDGKRFHIGVETGKLLKKWLESGVDAPKPEYKPATPAPAPDLDKSAELVSQYAAKLGACENLEQLKAAWTQIPKAFQPQLVAVKDGVKASFSEGK